MDTELGLRRYRDADEWPTGEMLGAMLDNQFNAFAALRQALPALSAATDAAATRLNSAGRLIYTGAGASGRLAVQDGVELNPTFGWPADRLAYLIAGGEGALVKSAEGAEDDRNAAAAEAATMRFTANDVLISVAASGITRYTNEVQRIARHAGALTIALANNPGAPLLDGAEHPILLHTGPEFLAGSTRMTAGTAQKIALNLLSTGIMARLGHIYRGLMVDMIPSNVKLRKRACGMVAAIAEVDDAKATEAWKQAGGNVKRAVLMLDGLSDQAATEALEQASGNLRKARGR